VTETSCEAGAMLLFYPMTGSEDIHNYILSDGGEMEGVEMEGMMAAAAPRAREDGLPDRDDARVFNDERDRWRRVT